MNPRDVVIQAAMKYGVDPRELLSVWQQEGSGSSDPSMRGPVLPKGNKYAGHYGIGPFQIMSFHDNVPSTFEGQADWAARYLKDNGVRGYYGETGSKRPMPGHPTTDEYEQQVMMRAQQMGPPPQNPQGQQQQSGGISGGINPAMLAQMGILPQQQSEPQQPPGLFERLMSDPAMILGASLLSASDPQGISGASQIGRGILAGNEAMQERKKLNAQIDRMSNAVVGAGAGRGLPENIREMMILKQMFPNMADEDIMSMAFTGRVQPGGQQVKDVGGQMFNVGYDQMGRPTYQPFGGDQTQQYQDFRYGTKKSESSGTETGKAGIEYLKTASGEYQKSVQQYNNTADLLDRFKAGEFDHAVGPISGLIGQFYNPDTSILALKQVSAALENLGITNLAPVSNYEIGLIQNMFSDKVRTKDQNIAILEELERTQKARKEYMKELLQQLRTRPIEEILVDPPVPDFRPKRGELYGNTEDGSGKGKLNALGNLAVDMGLMKSPTKSGPGMTNEELDRELNKLLGE